MSKAGVGKLKSIRTVVVKDYIIPNWNDKDNTLQSLLESQGEVGILKINNGSEIPWQVLVGVNAEQIGQFFVLDPSNNAELGKGAQGKVVRAQKLDFKSKQVSWVAIKIQKEGPMTFDEDLKRERQNLEKYQQRLIATADLREDDLRVAYTVMDYFPGINLFEFLYETNAILEEENIEYVVAKKEVDIVAQLRLSVLALRELIELHKAGLAHRDLKPHNFVLDTKVLFDNWRDLKLVDLGSAVIVDLEQNNDNVGTFGYISPEFLHEQRLPYDYRNDYFSFGVVLAEILTKHNYQQALKGLLTEQEAENKKRELSPEEIASIMPDVLDPSSSLYLNQNPAEFMYEGEKECSKEEISQMAASAVYQLLIPFVQKLIFSNRDERANLDELETMFSELKALQFKIISALATVPGAQIEKLVQFKKLRSSVQLKPGCDKILDTQFKEQLESQRARSISMSVVEMTTVSDSPKFSSSSSSRQDNEKPKIKQKKDKDLLHHFKDKFKKKKFQVAEANMVDHKQTKTSEDKEKKKKKKLGIF